MNIPRYLTNIELRNRLRDLENLLNGIGIDFQESVNNFYAYTTPPVSPENQDRYILTNASPYSGWDLDIARDVTINPVDRTSKPQQYDIVQYDSETSKWFRTLNSTETQDDEETRATGAITWVEAEDIFYIFNGTNWVNLMSAIIPTGGVKNDILVKVDGTDFNVAWEQKIWKLDTDHSITPNLEYNSPEPSGNEYRSIKLPSGVWIGTDSDSGELYLSSGIDPSSNSILHLNDTTFTLANKTSGASIHGDGNSLVIAHTGIDNKNITMDTDGIKLTYNDTGSVDRTKVVYLDFNGAISVGDIGDIIRESLWEIVLDSTDGLNVLKPIYADYRFGIKSNRLQLDLSYTDNDYTIDLRNDGTENNISTFTLPNNIISLQSKNVLIGKSYPTSSDFRPNLRIRGDGYNFNGSIVGISLTNANSSGDITNDDTLRLTSTLRYSDSSVENVKLSLSTRANTSINTYYELFNSIKTPTNDADLENGLVEFPNGIKYTTNESIYHYPGLSLSNNLLLNHAIHDEVDNTASASISVYRAPTGITFISGIIQPGKTYEITIATYGTNSCYVLATITDEKLRPLSNVWCTSLKHISGSQGYYPVTTLIDKDGTINLVYPSELYKHITTNVVEYVDLSATYSTKGYNGSW